MERHFQSISLELQKQTRTPGRKGWLGLGEGYEFTSLQISVEIGRSHLVVLTWGSRAEGLTVWGPLSCGQQDGPQWLLCCEA